MGKITKLKDRVMRLVERGKAWYEYVNQGVWTETRSNWMVDTVRTISLSIKSFFDRDLQMRASALTYQTVLAIVPALALVFAIARGFDLQDVVVEELSDMFSGQQDALNAVLTYVDNTLNHSSGGGVFVGVGVAFLLWIIISLISNVENAFNAIWGVKRGRSLGRKLTDYTAIVLILPILMICSNGLTIFMSTAMQRLLPFGFLTPAISWMLEGASLVMTWLFFMGTYMLVPNTKVRWTNALLAGCLAGTAFVILQWLFVNGQMYVARYNAVYGSVAFLPLFLVWAQLAWVVTLSGAVICYSSQNIFQFSFNEQVKKISINYRSQIAVAMMTVVVQRFLKEEKPLCRRDFAEMYRLPSRLVSDIANSMIEAGLLQEVVLDEKSEALGLQSALPPEGVTIGTVLRRLDAAGNRDFVPDFRKNFASVVSKMEQIDEAMLSVGDDIRLADLKILNPTKTK